MCSIIESFPILISGLGLFFVRGLSLFPEPAANIKTLVTLKNS